MLKHQFNSVMVNFNLTGSRITYKTNLSRSVRAFLDWFNSVCYGCEDLMWESPLCAVILINE